MKYLFSFCLLIYSLSSIGQNFVTKEGEFMDTAANVNLAYGSTLPYFYQGIGKYPKSSATLLKEVQEFLGTAHNRSGKQNDPGSGSGYITFHFVIDTTGKIMKKVSVTQTDEYYKVKHFDKGQVGELYDYLKTLDQWKIARFPQLKDTVFSYIAFMTFKISHGKVINIIP